MPISKRRRKDATPRESTHSKMGPQHTSRAEWDVSVEISFPARTECASSGCIKEI